MPAPVEFTLVFLSDAMILTKTRRDWRAWQAAYADSYRSSLDIGPLESAAEYMEFDYPDWFAAPGRHWRGCLEELAACRHLQSAVFDVPETTKEDRR